jgi:large exoprotein involved in heme utilization and adhesion
MFQKILIGGLTMGVVAAGSGLIQLRSEVAVLKAGSGIERRVEQLENLAKDIATDRDKRTIILQGIRIELDLINQRIMNLEGRRR